MRVITQRHDRQHISSVKFSSVLSVNSPKGAVTHHGVMVRGITQRHGVAGSHESMRSATNLILVAMAQSDMLTGLWPLPCYVYFYTFERAAEYVPYAWCFVYNCLAEYLPTICHTASIWFTVGLAVHRYAIVPALTHTT